MIDYLFLVLVAALCLCMLDTGVFPSLWAFNRLLKEGAALAQPPTPLFFFSSGAQVSWLCSIVAAGCLRIAGNVPLLLQDPNPSVTHVQEPVPRQ